MALVGLPRCRLGRSGSSFRAPVPTTELVSWARLASSAECRFSVGRSGSSEGVELVVVDAVSVEVEVSEVRCCMVGRLGSSAGVLVVSVLPVVEESELSDLRFMMGRSGSSSGVLPVDAVVPELLSVVELSERRFMVGRSGSSEVVDGVGVVEEVVEGVVVPELEVSEERRFMVGRSGSSLEAVLVVELVAVWGLGLSDAELWRTGRVLEGFRAATFLGAARGLTVP
jgi:hypothetical protein